MIHRIPKQSRDREGAEKVARALEYRSLTVAARICSKMRLLSYMNPRERLLKNKLKMVYWKSEKFWIGKLLEHPEIMTQGETLKELEENMKEAYILMTMEDVPDEYMIKEIALTV